MDILFIPEIIHMIKIKTKLGWWGGGGGGCNLIKHANGDLLTDEIYDNITIILIYRFNNSLPFHFKHVCNIKQKTCGNKI